MRTRLKTLQDSFLPGTEFGIVTVAAATKVSPKSERQQSLLPRSASACRRAMTKAGSH
jgi:hypothetical protein